MKDEGNYEFRIMNYEGRKEAVTSGGQGIGDLRFVIGDWKDGNYKLRITSYMN
jgi:hypothetical protein